VPLHDDVSVENEGAVPQPPPAQPAPSPPATPLPKHAAAVVVMSQLSLGVYVTLPFTVLVYMVSDWYPDASETVLARRTGFLASLSNLAGAVTSLPWGRYSDRNGRRPVLLIGNVAAAVSVCVLGLTRSYNTACLSRLAGGALNGSLGVVKAVISDVCDESNTPLAFSLMSTGWGVGAVLGPALGGVLSRPCAPGGLLGAASALCLPGGPLHGRPYVLPCFVSAALCATSAALAVRLPETLRRRCASPPGDTELPVRPAGCPLPAAPPPALPWYKDRQVLLCLAGYALTAFVFIQVDELIPLFAAAPEASGGLALAPQGLAKPLAFGGVVVFFFTLT
jgi:MFS family permease